MTHLTTTAKQASPFNCIFTAMPSFHSKPRLPRSPSTPGCSRPQVPELPQNPTESYRHRPRERTADLADSSAPHPPLSVALPSSSDRSPSIE
ncbi:hypothetical protein CPAR01_03696 [Colletotrichum paranaense]|uniref:Uncharacterized protein n=1 Tax=Colletotrichum paranaense TaxID=1914294 RepID=A0ABQ9SU64_9PEZI|nr:uncharacterized protein CPAR01_03696 [Colletotrichum paranaense]KAK1543063.1 hypothetical protein CPAR01_03696 [Colletotrichum paranaense]